MKTTHARPHPIPAGYLTLTGAYFAAHRQQILEFISARESRARLADPMQCIIDSKDVAQGVLVTTSDAQLACGIAIAVQSAFEGDLDLDFRNRQSLLRATWSR